MAAAETCKGDPAAEMIRLAGTDAQRPVGRNVVFGQVKGGGFRDEFSAEEQLEQSRLTDRSECAGEHRAVRWDRGSRTEFVPQGSRTARPVERRGGARANQGSMIEFRSREVSHDVAADNLQNVGITQLPTVLKFSRNLFYGGSECGPTRQAFGFPRQHPQKMFLPRVFPGDPHCVSGEFEVPGRFGGWQHSDPLEADTQAAGGNRAPRLVISRPVADPAVVLDHLKHGSSPFSGPLHQ
jgi:hypothetical protein